MSEHRLTEGQREELREVIRETVSETLVRVGLQSGDPIALQKDFSFLRQWRMATESVRNKGMLTLVGMLVTGVCAAIWIGARAILAAKGVLPKD